MAPESETNDANVTDDEVPIRADEQTSCARCGRQIDITVWHPLVTRTDDDGNFQLFAFCSGWCRDNWMDDED